MGEIYDNSFNGLLMMNIQVQIEKKKKKKIIIIISALFF